MAKISAHGGSELLRYATHYGTFLLRSDGRVLKKPLVQGSSWKLTKCQLAGTEEDMLREFRSLMERFSMTPDTGVVES